MNLDCNFVRPQARAPQVRLQRRAPPPVLYESGPRYVQPRYNPRPQWVDYDDDEAGFFEAPVRTRVYEVRTFETYEPFGGTSWCPLDWLFGGGW